MKSTPITLSIQHGGHPGTGRLRHGMRSVVAFEAKCHPQAGLSLDRPPAAISQVLGLQARYHTRLIQSGGSVSPAVTLGLKMSVPEMRGPSLGLSLQQATPSE